MASELTTAAGRQAGATPSHEPSGPTAAGRAIPSFDVRELFGGANEIRLRHRDEEYRLRLTRNRRLILTK